MSFLGFFRKYLTSESSAYRITDDSPPPDGWRNPVVMRRQHEAWMALVRAARKGSPRIDVTIAADAVRASGIDHPRLIEVGCGTGYYSELLELLAGPLDYAGVDYSDTMIAAARSYYPRTSFLIGDASRLPLADGCCDIGFSGNSLMHTSGYEAAVAEVSRIARKWCVYHSVPVLENRPTTRMHKRAYGADVFEVVFNRAELEALFRAAGLKIESVKETIPYDLTSVLHEHTTLLTYACSKMR